ncbi:MAG: molybdenum cofactor biosynthesis protein MoaE [Acidobacteria bacterium]|nr:molybdenum cofactor biosynthesis protein MoaE [Acidobacteriota bacterium]MCB9396946.1 molybdenum cofactor biosynthesis protein MoaE [Acidobacteriota bacterium]
MIDLIFSPIDEAALLASAGTPSCGAVLCFSGTVRNHHKGRSVLRLAYEAYEAMAVKQLQLLVAECCQKWPSIEKVQIVHRLGEIEVGVSSVFLTVASPHRQEAFAALQFLLDRLKQDVPIWKKEFYADGDSGWIHPTE